MGEPFIGEIKMLGFPFAPEHWADCNGNSVEIRQNPALYTLLGIQFGGDGVTNFYLPDLRGRVPVHPGHITSQGMVGGLETVTLTHHNLPPHTHAFKAVRDQGNRMSVGQQGNRFLAESDSTVPPYGRASNLVDLDSNGMTISGSGEAHDNTQPSLVIRYVIAMNGHFPSRN